MDCRELAVFADWMNAHSDAIDCRECDGAVILEAWITPEHVEAFNKCQTEQALHQKDES